MPKRLSVLLLSVALASPFASAASDQWTEISSSHFVVLTNSNEKQAHRILDQFERMRWVFQTLFPKLNTDPSSPILVFAAKNSKTFQAVEPQAYLAKGQLKLAGYFLTNQDENYILLRLDAEQEHPFATVYHEYTHLQFRSAGTWMPLWLNEGMAEFFQNTDIHDKDVVLGQASVDEILYLRQQRIIPLPVLFQVDAKSPYYHEENKGSVFYAESWALTHFLLVSDREKGTNRVTEYLNLVSHHEDPVTAAEKAFGDLKQLQSSLESYINANQYKQFVMHSGAAPIDESAFTVRTVTQVEADVRRAEILARVNREGEARELVNSILKTDPNNALAMEAMGGIEFEHGNHEAARKWYGDAVKLDPKSYVASYYFARLSMQNGDAEADPAIESNFRNAIQLNPKFAPAYDSLASYYGMHHMKLEEALTLASTAVKLEPGNLYFRLNAANLESETGRYDQAISIFQIAAKLARNRGELAMVQSRMDQLRQFQQDRARAEDARREAESGQLAEGDNKGVVQVLHVDETPKHPADAKGPKHSLLGVMRDVVCSYPALLELRVEGSGRSVKLYSNDFSKIDLTVIGFNPQGPMNPCKDFNGMKARVQYAESTDKTVDGQVFAIELRK